MTTKAEASQPAPAGGAAPYSIVVVVSLVVVGAHAVRTATANAPTEMIAHDFQFYIFLILQKTRSTNAPVEVLYREGTFAPDLRASDRPIAIACLRLFTFLPDFPDLSLPRFISCIARPTLEEAFLLYFRDLLFVAIVTTGNRGCLTRSFIRISAAKAISLVVLINEIMTASRLNLTI
jgi:hypothetical protein